MKLTSIIERMQRPDTPPPERPVHCVFYAHIWSVYCLEQALGLSEPKTTMLVELATQSHLGYALAPFNETRDSLLGLLQPGRHVHQLSQRYSGIAAPMVLAPVKPAQLSDVLNALALLPHDRSPSKKAVVLVNLSDAALFAPAYENMTDFSILWDSADLPDASLPTLAKLLAGQHCLGQGRWGGFKLCSHKLRAVADAGQRMAILQGLLAEFPELTV